MDKVSVIIPTLNESANISRCLTSIAKQTYHQIETIIPDNSSSDTTAAISRKHGAKVMIAGGERSSQRNCGAAKASGAYLLFLDADMELEPEVIAECVDLSKKGYQAVIISEKAGGKGFWQRCRKLEKECYLGDDLIEAARFFSKSLFNSLGGWDKNLIASEDWDLTQRARNEKIKIGRTKSFVWHREQNINPLNAARKKFYYGLSLGRYLKKYPKLAPKQYCLLRPAFVRNWKKLATHPLLTTGLVILKLFEFAGGGIGLIYARLK